MSKKNVSSSKKKAPGSFETSENHPPYDTASHLRRPEFFSPPLRRYQRKDEVISATSNKTSPAVRRIYWHHVTCHWEIPPYCISV